MRGKYFNYSLISIYAPTIDIPDGMKNEFYEILDKAYGERPKQDVEIVIGDANALRRSAEKVSFDLSLEREAFIALPTIMVYILKYSLLLARGMAINSTYFARNNIRKHIW